MSSLDPLGFLSLIVALSAYLAGVRLAILGRITPETPEAVKESYKSHLKSLVPADAAFIVAGVCQVARLFWSDVFGPAAPSFLALAVMWAFMIGVGVLVAQHVALWFKTANA